MLETDNTIKKIKVESLKFLAFDLIQVKIPDDRGRYLKKAAKILKGKRVIIGENYDAKKLLEYKIHPILPQRIYKYLTDKIFNATVEYFGLDKARVSVRTGIITEKERTILEQIALNSQHVSVISPNREMVADWLMENYGISPVSGSKKADILIDMFDEEFSLTYVRRNCKYVLSDVRVMVDDEADFSESHMKSACLAAITAGLVIPKQIRVANIGFICEN